MNGALVIPALLILAAALVPDRAAAEGISGYVDFGYTNLSSDSSDALGNSSRMDQNSFNQRYNLSLSRTLFPYLRLYANGLFNQADTTATTNGAKTDSTQTTIQPLVDLTLRSPVYTAGARYSRREDTARSTGAPTTTDINEVYTGILGMRPISPDFPTLDLRLERSHLYDQEHISLDTVRDFAGLIMNYTPTGNFSLQYRPTYIDSTNRLNGLETQTLSHVGRVEYGGTLLQNRVSYDANYNITYNELTTSVSGTGTVDIGVTPFAGLSSIDDTPLDGTLTQNPALIDGNLTAGAGINIGLPPLGGDTRERNIGIDFSLAQDVNTILLWVDRSLPAAIAGSFSWDVYTSADGTTWRLYTTVFPAPFGVFDNRFEIAFSSVHTRYIKVVVKPLSPAAQGAAGFPDILVTEIQAFSRKSADQLRGKSYNSSESFNFDGRALLLESPTLYYRVTYFLAKTEPLSQERWNLSNMLLTTHRFNRVFSGSAQAGREDFFDPTMAGFAYVTSMSLEAVPLQTLRHNLSYSGRFQEDNSTGRTDTNSFFLQNNAQVYKGVDLSAAGGMTFIDQSTGVRTESTDINAGLNVLPHRTLNLNFYIDDTRTHSSSRSTGADTTTWSRRTDETATYHPLETLYLVAGYSTIADQQKTRRVQNYAFNWSPFFGGDLQFTLAYNEGIESEKNTRTKAYGPSVTWKITRSTNLAASYQVTRATSDDGRSDSKIFSTSLRAYF